MSEQATGQIHDLSQSVGRRPSVAIGDIHGRLDLLDALLPLLGERHLIFLGDLTDRGPDSPGVIRRVRDLINAGRARLCLGNHDLMLYEWVLYGKGGDLWLQNGGTPEQWSSPEALYENAAWLEAQHEEWIVEGPVLFAHAMRPLKGDADLHLWGRPAQGPWASLPSGLSVSIHGHTPVESPQEVPFLDGSTAWFIDTGAVWTGVLSALDTENMHVIQVHGPAMPIPDAEDTPE